MLHAQRPIHFSATVHTGDTYIHPIGHGLYFLIDQADGGAWNFKIYPSPRSHESYTDCLGSPFLRGPSTVDLLAWRFAPGADSSWAESLPARKQFAFVTNATDQEYECAETNAMYDSFQRSQSAGRDPDYSGLPHYKPRPKGEGTVSITSVSFKPGLSGNNAEFKTVALEVTVIFPKDKKAGRR